MVTETMTKRETTTRRGFPGLRCLECGEKDCVQVHLGDMHFVCGECNEEFTAADVRAMVAAWADVLDWIDLAPIVK